MLSYSGFLQRNRFLFVNLRWMANQSFKLKDNQFANII